MGKKRDSTDLQLRLSLFSALIALLAIVVLVLGQRWFVTSKEEIEDLAEQGQIIGANAAAVLLFDDAAAGEEMLSALRNSSYVTDAAFYRANGSRLAVYHRQDKTVLPAVLSPESMRVETRTQSLRDIHVLIPIRIGGRDVGAMLLRSSMERVYRELGEFLEFFLMIMAVAVALAYFASYRLRRRVRESRQELVDSQYMIRQLSLHRERLVEDEHKRIAMEIHDDLGQILTTAMLHLKRLHRSLREEKHAATSRVEEIETLVEDAFRSIKNIAMDLRPAVLDFGLVSALEWLCERVLAGSGIAFHLTAPNPPPVLSERCSITLFRIAKESLTNILRHAHAKNVWITMELGAEQLSLSIEDDGVGFADAVSTRGPSFGLLGMRERAGALQGHAEISSMPGKGVHIHVTVPLAVALEQDWVKS